MYHGREHERYDANDGQFGGGPPPTWPRRYDGYGHGGGRRHLQTAREIQPQIPQQANCQQQYPYTAAGEQYQPGNYQAVYNFPVDWQQYTAQAGFHYGISPTAFASRQVQQQAFYPTSYYEQQRYYPSWYQYPQATYGPQQEAYVPHQAWSYQQSAYQQPAAYDYYYQQQHNLTQYAYATDNFNANATTFQPQDARRGERTAIDFDSASPTRMGGTPHLHILKRPRPSKQYLAKQPVWATDQDSPRRLLVVLDLNGTLLYRKARGGSSFVTRPKVNEFLAYLIDNHQVLVWSSAKPENVNAMCKKLFTKEQHSKLVAIWGRDTLRIPDHAYNSKVQVYKQLSWIWQDEAIQASRTDQTDRWDHSNTVLIDDSVEKAASEPHNLICLEEFKGTAAQMQSDVLGQVTEYLETLSMKSHVGAYMRVTPFKYQAVKKSKR